MLSLEEKKELRRLLFIAIQDDSITKGSITISEEDIINAMIVSRSAIIISLLDQEE